MARAVVVDGVSKRYRLGTSRLRFPTARDALASAVGERLRRARKPEDDGYVWALRGVSFSVEAGELVGIIGRNGAGKTTMLKVLSRITSPTSGYAELHGRVGSLLEVGTGFHPELTGRENVYLSGAILGMRRAEIRRRFDEIVGFAEIDDFLDTPIKRYSSGMKVRLAFAVAAHLEPEILIVDEVLAVGDLAFQKKSLDKMSQVTSDGRTVLFVSHNMSLLQALCRRGILLDEGSVVVDAPVGDAVAAYLRGLEGTSGHALLERSDRRGWQEVRLTGVEVTGVDGAQVVTGRPARFAFDVTGVRSRMACSFTILTHLGQPVTTLSSRLPGPGDEHDAAVGERFECVVDALPLVPGRYRLDVRVSARGHRQDELEAAAFFDVQEGLVAGRPVVRGDGDGSVVVPHRWRVPVERNGGGG